MQKGWKAHLEELGFHAKGLRRRHDALASGFYARVWLQGGWHDSKWFSDFRYGGELGAAEAAARFNAKRRADLGIPDVRTKVVMAPRRKHGGTAPMGVWRSKTHWFFSPNASHRKCGFKEAKWAVAEFSENRAKALAIKRYREADIETYGLVRMDAAIHSARQAAARFLRGEKSRRRR